MEPIIELKQVSYTYPGVAVQALKDISFTVPDGQICAVVGANGAGKTTLANAISGYVPHFYKGELKGEIQVTGKKTVETPLHELVLLVGLVFQNPFNQISGTKFSVREEIAFGLENLGIERGEMHTRTEEMMALVGIRDLADRSPLNLSGGQMQRVVLASILAMRPQVLVLDEPTSQLDPIGSREVLSAIRGLAVDHSMTVLVIEHKLEWLAMFAERIIALADGSIIADGSPREVLADEGTWRHGIGQTRYTQAARLAVSKGKWAPDIRLPVTLEEATAGFRAAKSAQTTPGI